MTPEERAERLITETWALPTNYYGQSAIADLAAEIRAAVADEREACAREAERTRWPETVFRQPPPGEHGNTVDACSASGARMAQRCIAFEIRARGDD